MGLQEATVLSVEDCTGVGALVRALVAADLDRALEVNLHRVRELEGLEVSVGEHGGAGPEVLDLGEA